MYIKPLCPQQKSYPQGKSPSQQNKDTIYPFSLDPGYLKSIVTPRIEKLSPTAFDECVNTYSLSAQFVTKPPKSVAIHDGFMHADDVFAIAMLKQIYTVSVIRSREESQQQGCDIIADVGGIYDGVRRFDHHQPEFNVRHPPMRRDMPYGPKRAAFGLLWLHFGQDVVISIWCQTYPERAQELTPEAVQLITDRIDKNFVTTIDMVDNGEQDNYISNYWLVSQSGVSRLIAICNMNDEDSAVATEEMIQDNFNKTVDLAEIFLKNTVLNTALSVLSARIIAQALAKVPPTQRYLTLDRAIPFIYGYNQVAHEYCRIVAIIEPQANQSKWTISFMKFNYAKDKQFYTPKLNDGDIRRYKIHVPKSVLGKRDDALSGTCGIPDMVFCHTSGFLAVAKTKEAAEAFVDWCIAHGE